MEFTIDDASERATQDSLLSREECSNDDVADRVRDIIYRNRKRNPPSTLRSPFPSKKSSLVLHKIEDSRLQNKHGFNINPPFIVHIEKIIHNFPSSTQVQDSEIIKTKNNVNTDINDLDYISFNSSQRSNTGSYGIIAFGKLNISIISYLLTT